MYIYIYICMIMYIYIYMYTYREREKRCFYWCLWNKHSSRWRWCFQCPDPAPLISKLMERCPTAANKNECLFPRPIVLTLRMSVTIDIGGDGGSPTMSTCRMSVYFADTGMTLERWRHRGTTNRDPLGSSCVYIYIYICIMYIYIYIERERET